MRIFTCTLVLALAIVLDSYEVAPRIRIVRRRIFEGQRGLNLDGSLEPVPRCISLLHYLPGAPPLRMLKLHINGTYMNARGPVSLLKRGNLVYGWDNAGVIDSLFDNYGRMTVLEGLTRRTVINENAFRQRFGIGDRTPGPAAAC